VLNGDFVRKLRNKMRAKNVAPRTGTDYVAHVHPDQTFDLMSETGTGAWQGPHVYGGDTQAIYAGEVGRYSARSGSSRTPAAPSGTGASTTYKSYILGSRRSSRPTPWSRTR
jgi:hypothetical protein